MSERKLTRATVPMCPECKAEMVWCSASSFYGCDSCADNPAIDRACTSHPDWGYYPIDVAVVVKGLRLYVSLPGQPPSVKLLKEWLGRLEGRHE